jgi:hypothetical protein
MFMRNRVCLSLAMVAGLSTLASAQLRQPGDIGRVKVSMGDARIERGTTKIPATAGLGLKTGDVLVTGKTGRVGVTFNDNSRFSAGPNSRIAVEDFEFDSTTHQGKFLTRVNKGTVAIVSGQIAKADKNAMRVKTPTALLGVRGTRFVVEVN